MATVCFVIPCWNEEKVVGKVVKSIRSTFKATGHTFVVVVVNDQSSDNSSEVARKSGAIVIDHILNQGAGGAVATGLRYARENGFDYVVTLDADGQHDPSDARSCLEKTIESEADLLIGSRMIDTGDMSSSIVLGNKGLSVISNLLFGIKVSDSQSGLRVFSQKAIENLRWKSSRYEFCSEMLLRAKQERLEIKEHPIKAIYTDYSNSKGQNRYSAVANGVHIVKQLVKWRITGVFE